MTNQRGFILPITLVIMFIVSSYTAFMINQYVIEKKFFFEQTEARANERLLQMGLVDSRYFLASSNEEYFSGTFYYEEGEVAFIVNVETEHIKSITLISTTLEQRSKRIKYFYYLETETFLPWLE
ncbi:competence type IV pilus minor pilin ComGG [Bacillaceae bacterium IKA-2]|nr:competence type IV pilus minor pilin ComGG [Bacillaceae bacterium IKA-2]